MDNQTRHKMSKIKAIIEKGDYEKALRMLKPIDHPMAGKWEIRLNKRITEQKNKNLMQLIKALVIIVLVGMILLVGVFMLSNYQIVNQPLLVDSTAHPSVEIIGTPTPTLDYIPWIDLPTATVRQDKELVDACKKEVQGVFSDVYDSQLKLCIDRTYVNADFRQRD